MLHYAVVFLVVALIAGALGFGGRAGAAVGFVHLLLFLFVGLAALSLIATAIRKA